LKTTVRNNPVGSDRADAGSGNLNWRAGFRGAYRWLLVNGYPRPTHTKRVNGVEIQTVEIPSLLVARSRWKRPLIKVRRCLIWVAVA
jgi:hypothetical protein